MVSPQQAKLPGDLRKRRKRYALSLPLPLAARLEALREMHPRKTRPQLIADLLRLGLAQVERAAASDGTDPADYFPDTRQPVYLLTGPFSEFHRLVTQHHIAMESALDPTGAQGTPPVDVYALVDGE